VMLFRQARSVRGGKCCSCGEIFPVRDFVGQAV